MNGAGSRDGFGASPWGRVDPGDGGRDATKGRDATWGRDALRGRDATEEPPSPDGPPPDGRPRYTQRQPTFTPIGRKPGDETVVDAFSPVRPAPGDEDHMPGNGSGPRSHRRDSVDGDNGAGRGRPGAHRARPGKPGKPGRKPRRRRSFWTELVALVAIAITLALVIKTYVVQAFFIPSGSMQNTLEIGDRVLINKMVYHTRGISRGDIVVFDGNGSWDFGSSSPSNPLARFWSDLEGVFGETSGNIYVKRVIGLPGDHVVCCNTAGQITVNGVPLTEQSYLYPGNPPSQQKFSIVVPPGRLWVMGDHRDVSYDSRGHMGDPGGGTIPESGVLGRAFVIIWPVSQWTILNIPATFEQPRLTASAPPAATAPASGQDAVLAAALQSGTPVRQAWTPLPLALGFAGAVPLTWLQRRVRRHARRGLARRRGLPQADGANRELGFVLYGQKRGGGGWRSGVPCEVRWSSMG